MLMWTTLYTDHRRGDNASDHESCFFNALFLHHILTSVTRFRVQCLQQAICLKCNTASPQQNKEHTGVRWVHEQHYDSEQRAQDEKFEQIECLSYFMQGGITPGNFHCISTIGGFRVDCGRTVSFSLTSFLSFPPQSLFCRRRAGRLGRVLGADRSAPE